MRHKAFKVFTAAIWLATLAGVPPVRAQETGAAVADPGAYRLLAGDVVRVSFPLNPELDTAGPIGPDGTLSLLFAGRVNVVGLTLPQAEAAVALALRNARIVADAHPSVIVDKYSGQVYVGGEVRLPGAVPLTRGLNPLQAIIQAGGLLDTAKSTQVAIIHGVGRGPRRIETANIRAFVKTGSTADDIVLAPGDIVFVPKSKIAEVDVWLDQHINKVVPNALHYDFQIGGTTGTTTVTTTPNNP